MCSDDTEAHELYACDVHGPVSREIGTIGCPLCIEEIDRFVEQAEARGAVIDNKLRRYDREVAAS